MLEKLKNLDWKYITVRTFSNALILGAVLYLIASFWDVVAQEAQYAYWRLRGQEFTLDAVEDPQEPPSPFSSLLKTPTPLQIKPKSTKFGIVIEKIDVNAPVIENVPVANKGAYLAALEKGVAHAQGSAKPGLPGNSYLFAHSSLDFWNYGPYSGVFNLLRKLDKGDRIAVFYKDKRYDYYVTNKEIVSGFNTAPLTRVFKEPYLTLQTCDPPGVALNRLIITAKLRNP